MAPLLVASTPIGNIGDATVRLRVAIESADVIAAEDSRKFHRLVSDLGIRFSGKVVSFFEGNESDRLPTLLDEIEAGKVILLLTDAGTPAVSDPGYRLIKEVLGRNLPFTVIPGPSAVLTALLYSGFATASFAFDGFLPRTESGLDRYFNSIKNELRTIVLFESPRRLESSLKVAARILGKERHIAICREMTKKYEEIFRGDFEQALVWANSRQSDDGIKGEVTLVIAPAPRAMDYSDEEILARAKELSDADHSARDIAAIIALEFDIPKRRAYDLANQSKNLD